VVERAEQHAEKLFDHLDSDEDGVVNAEEAASAAEDKAQREYDRLAGRLGESDAGIEVDPDSRLADHLGDIAADGLVTMEELSTAFADELSAFDQDGDGSITAEELSAGMVEEATERFEAHDTNDDSVINAEDRHPEEAAAEEEAEAEDGV
jgi:Ca2+-binding EF-hand superfamily protein